MNLSNKKNLVARTLNVSKERVVLVNSRIKEIKEAITKQDIRDLRTDGAILIKPIKGIKKKKRRNGRRGPGKIKIKVKTRKKDYATLTRKLRKHVGSEKEKGKISKDDFSDIRKKIRNKFFRSKAHLKEHIGGISNENREKTKKRK
ncbi:MAG: 50S ribosomal protein L19e [archaeon]